MFCHVNVPERETGLEVVSCKVGDMMDQNDQNETCPKTFSVRSPCQISLKFIKCIWM